jgi:hypothetical protein
MTLEELSKNLPKDWWEKLERAAFRERGRRHFYEKNYADKMTYDRFIYFQYLESEILWGRSCDERAIELLNKYDENHPTERFDKS